MEWDAQQAAEKGTALTWNTLVGDIPGREGTITYKRSVELHLQLMRISNVSDAEGQWSWKVISVIWDLVVSPIVLPEAKGELFDWLSSNYASFNNDIRVKLTGRSTLCSDSLKDLPGYGHFHSTCLRRANHENNDSSSSDSDSDSDSDD